MNMRGDNEVKRRGKSKELRGKKEYMQMNEAYLTRDFTWGSAGGPPKNLVAHTEIKGQWTYPKKGFIQWITDTRG